MAGNYSSVAMSTNVLIVLVGAKWPKRLFPTVHLASYAMLDEVHVSLVHLLRLSRLIWLTDLRLGQLGLLNWKVTMTSDQQ